MFRCVHCGARACNARPHLTAALPCVHARVPIGGAAPRGPKDHNRSADDNEENRSGQRDKAHVAGISDSRGRFLHRRRRRDRRRIVGSRSPRRIADRCRALRRKRIGRIRPTRRDSRATSCRAIRRSLRCFSLGRRDRRRRSERRHDRHRQSQQRCDRCDTLLGARLDKLGACIRGRRLHADWTARTRRRMRAPAPAVCVARPRRSSRLSHQDTSTCAALSGPCCNTNACLQARRPSAWRNIRRRLARR